jgi:hypothetical protein
MTTRRNVVTGMLAATTLPAAALAAPGAVDPIFAAIEAHRGAWADNTIHREELDNLEDTLGDEVTRSPRVRVAQRYEDGQPCYAHSDNEIRETKRSYRYAFGPEAEAEEIAKALAELDADRIQLKKARDNSGLTAAIEKYERLFAYACEKTSELMETTPTTPAGHVAKWRHILDSPDEGFEEWYCHVDAADHLMRSITELAKLAA